MNPVVWFVLGAALLPLAWHAVTEHHVHLRFLRLFRKDMPVPVTAHHQWWHSLPRARRLAVQAALLLCGAAFGVAYPLAPGPVAVILALAVATAAGLGVRMRLRREGTSP